MDLQVGTKFWILEVQKGQGMTWDVYRVKPGLGAAIERMLDNCRGLRRLHPDEKTTPKFTLSTREICVRWGDA